MSRLLPALLVALLVLLAFAARAVFVHEVFTRDGGVVLSIGDAYYHARVAWFDFLRFPAVLSFDPYLNHPDGSAVPWPPLYDFGVAAAARLWGDSRSVLEHTLAWAAPVLGALAVIPVALAGRMVGGWRVALAGAALYAVVPASVYWARVGNADHHAAVSLITMSYLAAAMALVRPTTAGRRLVLLAAGLLVARAVLVLSWSGSLLYLALGEASLLLVYLLSGRASLLFAQAAGTLGSAAIVATWVGVAAVPAGGAFSTTSLSWFHVLALLGVAAVSGGLGVLERKRPAASWLPRLVRAGVWTVLVLAAVLALEAPRQALVPSLEFLTKGDDWMSEQNLEGRSLFGGAIPGAQVPRVPASTYYGYFAYAIPLAMLVTLWRVRTLRVREPAACLAVWTLVLGALAIHEVRFSPDFAAVGSVAFALLLDAGRRGLASRRPARSRLPDAVFVLAALLALAPIVPAVYAPALRGTSQFLRGTLPESRDASLGAAGTLIRFAHDVKAATPETRGYLDPSARPEYGLLAQPSLAHALRYGAERALPADLFGPYLAPGKVELVNAFFAATDESAGLAIARRLGTRYVVTSAHSAFHRAGLEQQLHVGEGSGAATGTPRLEHFRLITEGPRRGRPFLPVRSPGEVVAYKLFEIVEGAVLEAEAAPGTVLWAELGLETPLGRRFAYRAATRADADGNARLRLPYSSRTDAPTRASEPYRVRVGDQEFRVSVSDEDVRTGATVTLGADDSGLGSK